MARIVLQKGRVKAVWLGHPWLFRGAIERVEGSPEPGDLVDVVDPKGQELGRGWWHPESAIAVRLLRGGRRGDTARDWFTERLTLATAARKERLSQGGAARLLNSEGDGVPGVAVDLYGDVAAVAFTSFGAWRRREDLFDALEEVVSPRAIVEVDGGAPPVEGIPVGPRVVRGEGETVQAAFGELGVRYELELPGGQKTGWYLDQADNRALVAGLAPGRRCLDLYTYQGAFALAAAKAGAVSAVGVDSSGPSLARAEAHGQRAGLDVTWVRDDVLRYLKAAQASGLRFDLAVLDPPPMARSARNAADARAKLRALHRLVLPLLDTPGLMLTCSCSRHLGHDDLERVLGEAGRDTDRDVQVLRRLGAADDHPVLLPCVEGRYLSALLVRVL